MSPHHPGPRHRPSTRHQRWLYVIGAALFLSGVGWLVSRYALRQETAMGLTPHPTELWWLRLHGAAVVVFLMVFGALYPIHVIHNWRRRRHRKSGALLITTIFALALTGYGLYYVVSDEARSWVSLAHWILGMLAAMAFALHVLMSRRRGRQRRLEAERA